DAVDLDMRSHLNLDMITWECDYPHSDSTWPTSPEMLQKALQAAAVPDDEVTKITHENAMRIFSYDPFAHRPKEQCTVGALRAESPDVDVVTRSPRQKKSNTDISSFVNTASKVLQSD